MASLSLFALVLNVIGVFAVLWLSLKAVWGLARALRIYVLSEWWRGVDLASYGPWAVVTGSTSGIGKAYAHELARRGLNIVLISRSLEKLKQVAAEIEAQHGRSTKVIQADFTRGSDLYGPIRDALQGLEIGILVNNVGQARNRPLRFLDNGDVDKFVHDMVHCNMLSYVKMTQLILPQMVAREKGIVINMSSGIAGFPFPMALLYSASKAFDDFFSRGLALEYSSKGIIVQSVIPLFVESNMTISIKSFFKISAEYFARQALNTVGLTDRTSGSLSHSIPAAILDLMPDSIFLSAPGFAVMVWMWEKFHRINLDNLDKPVVQRFVRTSKTEVQSLGSGNGPETF